jgi:sulfur carrier protein
MTITLNGESLAIRAGCTLAALLHEHNLDSRTGIAVALNDRVIARSDWTTTILTQNDSILVITAAQGG